MKRRPKKQSKKIFNMNSEVRKIGIFVEETRDDVKLVAEQYGDIKSTLDEHTKILGEHTEMIGSIKTDIEIIKSDTEFIKYSLKKKVDIEEFAALEKRVALLEKKR